MFLENLCTPALIYLIFSFVQIVLDIFKGFYNKAIMKFWVSGVFTLLLNFLCEKGLGVVSWVIVFIPFVLMSLIVAVLLVMFGLNPKTGLLNKEKEVVPEVDVRAEAAAEIEKSSTTASGTTASGTTAPTSTGTTAATNTGTTASGTTASTTRTTQPTRLRDQKLKTVFANIGEMKVGDIQNKVGTYAKFACLYIKDKELHPALIEACDSI